MSASKPSESLRPTDLASDAALPAFLGSLFRSGFRKSDMVGFASRSALAGESDGSLRNRSYGNGSGVREMR